MSNSTINNHPPSSSSCTLARDSNTNQLRKSLSYVELRKQIENLLPISTSTPNQNKLLNPRRKSSGGRRQSKTFRQKPRIVIEPPPDENVTNSMPDIRKSLLTLNQSLIGNNHLNASCPDLIEIVNSPIIIKDSVCENDSLLLSKTRTRKTNLLSQNQASVVNKNLSKQKYTQLLSRKKFSMIDDSPSNFLKQKIKHSLSMNNIFKTTNLLSESLLENQENYHTIHGNTNFNYENLNYPSYYSKSLPTTSSRFVGNDFDSQFSSGHYEKIKSVSENVSQYDSQYESSSQYLVSNSVSKSHISKTPISTRTDVVIYKCCCGGQTCKSVVPIHQYLETYFTNTVRIKGILRKSGEWEAGLNLLIRSREYVPIISQ